jgi:hypothetical protein
LRQTASDFHARSSAEEQEDQNPIFITAADPDDAQASFSPF